MSQKWPVIGFEWRKDLFRFEEEFIQNFDEDSNKGYILEVYVEFHRELWKEHSSDLSFLPERMKINKSEKLVFNLYGKKTMSYT